MLVKNTMENIRNIWIDVAHIPQFNFYRNLILRFVADGHKVFLTVLDRGKLPDIVRRETAGVPNLQVTVIGRHRSKRWSAILEANLLRNVQLLWWARGKRFDIGYSNGYQLALASRLKRFPSYSFDDDPDTPDYRPKLWFNREACYCLYGYTGRLSPKAHVLPVLKEWAYLAKDCFRPDPSVLDEYGLQPGGYVFLREVSVGTVNYSGQAEGAVLDIKDMIPEKFRVLLSLERKSQRGLYPPDWTLLDEPLRDVRSLVYYSAGLVSSGDSMAREAALMGVPSYYLGIRYDMPANAAAARVARLQNRRSCGIAGWLQSLECNPDSLVAERERVRDCIAAEFIDINAYMYNLVTEVK